MRIVTKDIESKEIFNNLSYLFVGQFVSLLGSQAFFIVEILWLKQQTQSALYLATASVLSTLPFILLSPLAGTLVDRWCKKTVVVVADIVAACIVGAILLLISQEALPTRIKVFGFLVGVGCLSVISSFFVPAVNGLIPQLARKPEYITRANSIVAAIAKTSDFIGQGLGGFVFHTYGVFALLFDVFSFLFSGLSISRIRNVRSAPKTTSESRKGADILREMKEGWNYIRNEEGIVSMAFIIALLNLCHAPFAISLTFFIDSQLRLPESYFGYFMAVISVGSIIGSLAVTIIHPGKHQIQKVIACSLLGCSLSFLAFATATTKPAAFVLVFLGSLTNSYAATHMNAILIRRINQAYIGRTISLLSAVTMALGPLSTFLAGMGIDTFGDSFAKTIFLIMGGLMAFVVVMLYSLKPMRNFLSR